YFFLHRCGPTLGEHGMARADHLVLDLRLVRLARSCPTVWAGDNSDIRSVVCAACPRIARNCGARGRCDIASLCLDSLLGASSPTDLPNHRRLDKLSCARIRREPETQSLAAAVDGIVGQSPWRIHAWPGSGGWIWS